MTSPGNNKKTVLRTIRITQSLDNLLQKDAKAKRMNVNAFVTSILTKHAEWDRLAERFGGTLTIRHEAIRAILDLVSDNNAIYNVARDASSRIPKEFLLLWFKKIDVDSYFEYLSLLCRYAGWAELEIDKQGDEYIATLIHNVGEKWSYWLKGAIEGGIENNLGVLPKSELSKTSVIFRIRML